MKEENNKMRGVLGYGLAAISIFFWGNKREE